MKILVTGGAGFIGSNFIRYCFNRSHNYEIINFDKLTYAGNLKNLEEFNNNKRYHFIKGDICNSDLIGQVLNEFSPRYIVNFAFWRTIVKHFHFVSFWRNYNLGTSCTEVK